MRPPFQFSILLGVLVLHGGVMVALLSVQPTTTITPAAALMVEMVAPAVEPLSPPKPTPKIIQPSTPTPLPRPTQPTPVTAPVLATQGESVSMAADVPKPLSAPTPVPTAPAVPVAVAPSVPRFDADYLNNPSPAYPPLSRRLREEGKVMLRVFVEASGAAGTVEIRTSSGFERLDKSAISAVSRWKFVPAKQGAEAVGAWVVVPIIFSLKD